MYATLENSFYDIMTALSHPGDMIVSMVESVADFLSISPINLVIITVIMFTVASIGLYVMYRSKVNKSSVQNSLRKIRRNRHQKY